MKRITIFFVLLSGFVLMTAPVFAKVPAPEFTGTDSNGIQHSLSDYKGKPLVLYFWATWCPGCRRDTEAIKKVFAEKLVPKGYEMLGVSLDTDLTKLQNYIKEHEIPFPVLFAGKAWENELAKMYEISSTPSFVFIDEEGNIKGKGNWSRDLVRTLQYFE